MSKKKKDKKKHKKNQNQNLLASGGFCAPTTPLYDFLPVFKASRGGIVFPTSGSTSQSGGGDSVMHISISKLAHVGSLVAFVAAVFGNTVFGHAGLELVSAGLALHVGGELLEDVLAD